MDIFVKVTELETLCFFRALCCKNRSADYEVRPTCQHPQEFDFFNKHPYMKSDKGAATKCLGLIDSLSFHGNVLVRKYIVLKVNQCEFDKIIEQLHQAPSQVLFWCGSLLMNHHHEKECSNYVSLALKFYLKSYEVSEFINRSFSRNHSKAVKSTMLDFLKCISLNKCDHALFVGCLYVFLRNIANAYLIPWKTNHVPGLRHPILTRKRDFLYPILPKIFKRAHELGFNLLSLWNDKNNFLELGYTHNLTVYARTRFIRLVTYGYEDKMYPGVCQDIISSFKLKDTLNYFEIEKIAPDNVSNIWFRILQVLYFLRCKRHHAMFEIDALGNRIRSSKQYPDPSQEKVLRVLWNTIPDPFLTRLQFMFFCRKLRKSHHYDLLYAIEWYEKNVRKCNSYAPRSLQHYSKCVLRRRLAACGHLPFGIASLPLPTSIKHYLLLKNCKFSSIK